MDKRRGGHEVLQGPEKLQKGDKEWRKANCSLQTAQSTNRSHTMFTLTFTAASSCTAAPTSPKAHCSLQTRRV